MTTTIQLTDADYELIHARQEAIRREHLAANRERIVDASKALALRLPAGMGTTREEMQVRCAMAQLVGALQGLAASGDLSDDGVRCVVECLGRCG